MLLLTYFYFFVKKLPQDRNSILVEEQPQSYRNGELAL